MSGDATTTMSLYRRALGVAYETLPPILRHFHDAQAGAEAQGKFKVTRGKGIVRSVMADMMALPKAGDDVNIHLEVKVERGGERWIRQFDSQCLITEQWLQDGLLVEAAGPIRFGFRLTADASSIRFAMERCWLTVVPIPLVLAPRVSATVTGGDSSWLAMVQVEMPIFGLLVRYEGELTPLASDLTAAGQNPTIT